jgi:hypothetical protein
MNPPLQTIPSPSKPAYRTKGFILELAISVLIAGAILTFIAFPLFSSSRAQDGDETNALETLGSQRDGAYDALHDLDFDFQTGKLSETDYTALRDKYKARAAVILQQIDTVQAQDAELEKQIADRRAEKQTRMSTPAADDEIEQEIVKRRGKRAAGTLACQNCGTPYHSGDQFCAQCGNKL